jgi:hypothetical protein
MSTAPGERLIAFEAAMQELATLQNAAARHLPLEREAATLLGELQDLGRELRHANRRGIFTETVVEEAVSRVRRMRHEWHRRLADLRESYLYRRSLEAYAAGDQALLGELLPALFVGLQRADVAPPLYQPLILTGRRRGGPSPFRSPETVAAGVASCRAEGLNPRPLTGEWWDTDFPGVFFAEELEHVDSPAALSIERLPSSVTAFREADAIVVFASSLPVDLSVVLALGSDDTWYEAAEGSYEQYRDALQRELAQREVPVRLAPAWS